MRIIEISAGPDDKRWDAYVGPRATSVTDLSAWRRIVHETYGMPSKFLAATQGDRFVGCLGLFEVKHPVFGHYLTTAPFSNDGGLYFDNTAACEALLREAKGVADQLEVDYLVIRTRNLALEGFEVDRHYQTAVIDLSKGAKEVWDATLPSKTRNQIRRGMKEEFSVTVGHEQVNSFYDILHRCMRDLGSPAPAIHFYRSIIENLGDSADFFVVRDGNHPVAGALLFWNNGTAMNYHTVAVHKYNRRCPNYLIYWKMIEMSCERGLKQFDMGRSVAESSNLAFKMNWGPALIPLCYNYYLRRLEEIPYVNPRNPRYRIPIAVWKRLPVFITKGLGPRLMKGIT